MIDSSPAVRAALKGNDPTPEQWVAISHPLEPVAIIAGAGSGKTAVMAARIAWMIEQGAVRPAQILALSFTNKAANELEERVMLSLNELYESVAEKPVVATYNSFADRIVREHGVRVGIDPDVGLLSEAQSWQLALRVLADVPPFEAIDSRSVSSICRTALSLADQCANHFVTPERLIEHDSMIVSDAESFPDDVVAASRKRIELARLVRAYMDSKMVMRRIDFGDQVWKAVEILEKFPEVAFDMRARYPALLLDEYQDTNVAQRRLLQLLAPTGHNVTAVGDARQNIFQWRGSTLFNLIDFPAKHFLRDGERSHAYLSLSENFRSGSNILAVANQVVDAISIERRPGLPLQSHPSNLQGAVFAKVLADQHAEAGFIAEEIAALHGANLHPDRPPADWKSFAILVRRKSHIGALYAALKARDIPVEVIGLSGLLQIPEVIDTVAWLRVLAEPGPSSNRWVARLLMGPRFRVHYRDLAKLSRWAAANTLELADEKRAAPIEEEDRPLIENETLFEPDNVAFSLTEALEHLDEVDTLSVDARTRLALAAARLQEVRNLTGAGLLEIVTGIVQATGILESVIASPRSDAGSRRDNLMNFLSIVEGFSPVEGDPTLAAFLSYLDAAEEVDETLELGTVAQTDSVKLMTIHQAKGLEFDAVFVPGVSARAKEPGEFVDSIFPDERVSNPMTSHGQLPFGVREDAEHLPSPFLSNGSVKKKPALTKELKERAVEDERRLFYVALTRARHRLYVTSAWWYEKQGKPRGPSLFFQEVATAPETSLLPGDEMPPTNPLIERLKQMAVWPPHLPERSNGGFAEGFERTVEQLQAGEITPENLLEALGPRRAGAELALSGFRNWISTLTEEEQPSGEGLRSLSVTDAVRIGDGSMSIADVMRPIPERPTSARRIGTEIHRWIEDQARELTGLADESALDQPSAAVAPEELKKLRSAWIELGFKDRRLARLDTNEPMAEVPFVLKLGDKLIRGRIDAVYETDEGGLEVVDFKTGQEQDVPEADQLAIYAGALGRMGFASDVPLKLSYVYLASRNIVSRTISFAEADRVLATLGSQLSG